MRWCSAMLFTSNSFLIFLPVVFAAYWLAGQRGAKAQNVVALLASYVFYGWMDWRLCGLLTLSTASAFVTGLWLERGPCNRKFPACVSLAINLGVLGFFKYYNFFAKSIAAAFEAVGWTVDVTTLQLVLPVGVSFYSFMSISYTIDVYRGTIGAARTPVAFFASMSFFPQLLAGPIGRTPELLPQFEKRRVLVYDTPYHLNLLGRELRTEMMVEDVTLSRMRGL